MRAKDLAGVRFGRLIAVAPVLTGSRRRWRCDCSCGAIAVVATSDLTSGKQISCGCHRDENTAKRNRLNVRHGKTGTRTYISWFNMMQRCNYPRDRFYRIYGGRGIKVCQAWHDFVNFYRDMGERPEGKTLDRIDNDRGYEPGNCRWATAVEQGRNRRPRVRNM